MGIRASLRRWLVPLDPVRRLRDAARIRAHLRQPFPQLHLGAGPRPIDGWLNADLVPLSPDVTRADGRCLPYPDAAFERAYLEHVIEHVDPADGQRMLDELFRVLRPGGRIRIATPDLAFAASLVGPDHALSDAARTYVDWVRREVLHDPHATPEAVGARLQSGWGHRCLYSRPGLADALRRSGFTDLSWHGLQDSDEPAFRGLANEDRLPPGMLDLETMTVQARRPT